MVPHEHAASPIQMLKLRNVSSLSANIAIALNNEKFVGAHEKIFILLCTIEYVSHLNYNNNNKVLKVCDNDDLHSKGDTYLIVYRKWHLRTLLNYWLCMVFSVTQLCKSRR